MPASNVRIENDDIVMPGTAAHTVKNLAEPSAPTDAATKAYVDALEPGDSDKIEDTSGDTRVETEEEPDTVTITAGGQRTHTITEGESTEQIAPNATARTHSKRGIFTDWMSFGLSGPVRWIESTVDALLPIAIDAVSAAVDEFGAIIASEKLVYLGKLGADVFITESSSASETNDWATFDRATANAAGHTTLLRQESESSRARVNLECFNAGPSGAGTCGIEANEDGLFFHAHGNAAGAGLPFNEQAITDPPPWVTSLVHGLTLGSIRAPGPTSYSGVTNVSGTPSAGQSSVWISQGTFTIKGDLLVTPAATGLVVVSADVSTIGNPGGNVGGRASAFEPGVSVPSAACRVTSTGGGTLQVVFEATSTGAHTVSYEVEYSA